MIRWSVCFFVACYLLLSSALVSAQTRVLILHTDFVSTQKIDALSQFAEAAQLDLQALNVERLSAGNGELVERLSSSDYWVLDVPRSHDRALVEEFLSSFEVSPSVQLVVGGGAPTWQGLSATLARHLIQRYANGGRNNYEEFFSLLAQSVKGRVDESLFTAVESVASLGFYHTAAPQLFENIHDYLAWHEQYLQSEGNHFQRDVVESKGRVAFLVSSNVVTDLATDIVDEIILAAEFADIQPIVFWWRGEIEEGDFFALFKELNLDALVNLTHLQNGNQLIADFEALDISVIQTLRFREGDVRQWPRVTSGVSASVAASFLALPETWGLIDPIVLSARSIQGRDVLLPKQLAALIAKLNRVIDLRKRSNADKKLALLFWNYPPGEKNLGASNLNVPRSILSIQQALNDAGYAAGQPLVEEVLIEELQALLGMIYRPAQLDDLLVDIASAEPLQLEADNYALLSVSDYEQWLQTLPAAVQSALRRHKSPRQHAMVRTIQDEEYFVLPRLRLGNLLLMPQMPREGNPNAHYHDMKRAPDHMYFAAYYYLQKSYAADALIHLGTHGTQEWLPGKDRGLSVDDYPWLMLGDIPVVYPYLMDNVGEAIQTKRRGRAVNISHQTPAFIPSGLYEHLRDMHDLIHELSQLDEGTVRQQTMGRLIALAEQHHMMDDIGWSAAQAQQDEAQFLAELHDYLHDVAQTAMPIGLHTFGEIATEKSRVATVMQQLGESFYEALGLDGEAQLVIDAEQLQDHPAYQHVAAWIAGEETIESLEAFREEALGFHQTLINQQENAALLRALAGGYVLPGQGGDPIRQPGIESGRNLYAFEATKIPSQQAFEAGGVAFEQLLAAFQQDNDGAYPKKLAFSLWSSEAIRHLGVTEAQILHALGLRPVWGRGGRVERFEILSTEELGRPRVDVVVQVTGVYRDQFDHFMTLLNQAIAELSQLDETPAMNPISYNTHSLAQALLAEEGAQLSKDEAMLQAGLRIFSNDAGYYGTGVPHLALESTTWEDEAVLAQQFIRSQSYPYRGGVAIKNNLSSQARQQLFSTQLKGAEAAIMSRSSNLHGVLSTDHGFEFLGGLSAAIELVDGKAPQLLVADLRSNEPKTTPLPQFLAKELRTHYLNPAWIKGMQQEGYAGALEILDVSNNLFGWQVMNQEVVRDDQWLAMFDVFVMDQYELDLEEWFETHHPNALGQVMSRMVEAIRKGYWQASEETQKNLAERWQALNERHELTDIPPVSRDFIEQMAAGFGMNVAAEAPSDASEGASVDSAASSPDSIENQVANEVLEQVQGQVLAPVEVAEPKQPSTYWILLLVLWVLAGAWWQYRQNYH